MKDTGFWNSWHSLHQRQSRWQRTFAKKHPWLMVLVPVCVVSALAQGLRSEGIASTIALGFGAVSVLVLVFLIGGVFVSAKTNMSHSEDHFRQKLIRDATAPGFVQEMDQDGHPATEAPTRSGDFIQ